MQKITKSRFIDETGRRLTLKRGAPEWFNEDCPSIWRESDGYKVWHGWSLDAGIKIEPDDKDYLLITNFIAKSRIAFIKKYPQCA